MNRLCGVLAQFFAERGFGFIQGDDGSEFFVHQDRLLGELPRLLGERVAFTPDLDSPRGPRALDVRLEAEEERSPLPPPAGTRIAGSVKYFRSERAFGFVAGDDGRSYFIHRSDFVDKVQTLDVRKGCRLEFEPTASPQGPRGKFVRLAPASAS